MTGSSLSQRGVTLLSHLTRHSSARLSATAWHTQPQCLKAAEAAQRQSGAASCWGGVWTCGGGLACLSSHAGGRMAHVPGSLPSDKYDSTDLEVEAKLEQYKLKLDNDQVWPTTLRQSKFGARLRKALDVVLSSDPAMVSLSRSTGFGIEEVRMSADLQKAFILWDAFPKRMEAAERGITRNMCRVRAMTSKKLGAKFMPWLDFRRDQLTSEQRNIAELMDEWEAEMAATGEVDVREGERKEWSIHIEPPSADRTEGEDEPPTSGGGK